MILNIYLAVGNMDRAVGFYIELFNGPPVIQTEKYPGFKIGDILFSLMSASSYTFPLTRGNSFIPNIFVANIEGEYSRIKKLNPPRITKEIA